MRALSVCRPHYIVDFHCIRKYWMILFIYLIYLSGKRVVSSPINFSCNLSSPINFSCNQSIMRSSLRYLLKGCLPLLFIAAVVISIVAVGQVYGRERSSTLIYNGPTTTSSDDDDNDGLRIVGNESKVNTTTTPTTIYTTSPIKSPTAASPPTSTEKVATNVPSAISSMLTKSPTLRPNSSPSETIRSRFPSALPTLEQPSQAKQ
jgi:hypothetical protein